MCHCGCLPGVGTEKDDDHDRDPLAKKHVWGVAEVFSISQVTKLKGDKGQSASCQMAGHEVTEVKLLLSAGQ